MIGKGFTLIQAYKGLMIRSVAVSGLLALIALVPPYVTKILVDNVYPSKSISLLELVLVFNASVAVIFPSVASDDVQQALRGEPAYGPVDAPVLGVFGTSSQQGKLQLILRRHLGLDSIWVRYNPPTEIAEETRDVTSELVAGETARPFVFCPPRISPRKNLDA